MRVLSLFLLSALLFQVGCERSLRKERKDTLEVPYVKGTGVQVDTHNGSIEVKQSDREEILITATLKGITNDRLAYSKVVAERGEDKVLHIYVLWAEGARQHQEGCNFEIELPDSQNITLNSTNGPISIERLKGSAHLRTSNGAISVLSHAGDVKAQTANGEIVIDGSLGKLQLSTSNSAIEVLDAEGAVDATTTNGNIQISLASDSKGPVSAKTTNGAIVFTLSKAFSGKIDLSTSNGKYLLTGLEASALQSKPTGGATIQIGDSDQLSLLTTTNSNITIRKK